MKFKAVIPARLRSTRLPGKVLRAIAGKPLVRHVWEIARKSGADEIVIATDDTTVRDACRAFGANVVMTSTRHGSGTDRINEVARKRRWAPGTIVVNVQGDEPLLPPALIRQAAQLLAKDRAADIATLCHPMRAAGEWLNPNVVKVVMDARGRALYFSRAPIPWQRSGGAGDSPAANFPAGGAFRHIGLYAYRVSALKRFSARRAAALEKTESLEQLRALVNGLVVRVGVTRSAPPRGVDTEADLAEVERILTGE